ncbi:MAG: hypothetical protein ABIZ50_06435, partial [Solirubrobacterales bacterium]
GSVLVTSEVRAETEDSFAFSAAGHKHLKGIGGTVEAYRCRDLDDEPDDAGEDESDEKDSAKPRKSSRRRRRRGHRS